MDKAIGVIADDEANVFTNLAKLAPGVPGLTEADFQAANPAGTQGSPTASAKFKREYVVRLQKRWGIIGQAFNWVNTNIIQPVIEVVVDLVEAAAELLKKTVELLNAAREAAFALMQKAAAALLPTFNPSVSFTIPIKMKPHDSMLDDSPWGDAYKVLEWTMDGFDVNFPKAKDMLSKTLELDEVLKIPGKRPQSQALRCIVWIAVGRP